MPSPKSTPPEDVPAYVALAAGPGTLAQAVALQSSQEDELASFVEDAPKPSSAYQRVHEELSQYVTHDIAEAALDAGLRLAGVSSESATSLDLREVLGEILPDLLGPLLAEGALDEVIERLHLALTDVNQPSKVKPRGDE